LHYWAAFHASRAQTQPFAKMIEPIMMTFRGRTEDV